MVWRGVVRAKKMNRDRAGGRDEEGRQREERGKETNTQRQNKDRIKTDRDKTERGRHTDRQTDRWKDR